jgi:hypothetical protein
MVMAGKRTRTTRVPSHLRFAARFPPSTTTGSERKITSPKTWVADVSRLSQAAKSGSRQSRPNASCLDAICRASSSVSAATMATWRLERLRSLSAAGAQAKQLPRLADFDSPFRNDFQLVVFGCHQSAVRSRRMVNSMAPSGSSRHRSTSLI